MRSWAAAHRPVAAAPTRTSSRPRPSLPAEANLRPTTAALVDPVDRAERRKGNVTSVGNLATGRKIVGRILKNTVSKGRRNKPIWCAKEATSMSKACSWPWSPPAQRLNQ